MPKPKKDEKEKDFISRCIPIVMDEGTAEDNKQAAAICYSMWRESKKEKEKAIDGEDIAAIVGALEDCKAIGPDEESRRVRDAPIADDDKSASAPFTNTLKAISVNDDTMRVGNYMVLWNARDLEGIGSDQINADGTRGEYFTPETEFDSDYTKTGQLYVDFDHGTGMTGDGDDLPAPSRDDILGYVDWKTAKADKRGLWAERVLILRNKYMQFLKTLIEAGLIGSSSEAVGSKVKKATDGKIETWPLRRDSLTVIPMDWRMMTQNPVVAKAFVGLMKSISLELPELPEPEHEPQDDGEGDGGPSRLDVERARAKAEATLSYIKTLEEVTE